MSYRLIVVPLAEEKIRNAAFWYNTEKKGLRQDFLVALSEKLLLIEQHPEQFPIRYVSLGAALVNRFPYLIYFRIVEQTIRVLAVLHARREPGTARRRR